MCAPLQAEAGKLETELLAIYKCVVLSIQSEEDLNRVAKSWGLLVAVCDETARRLNALAERYPSSRAQARDDRVLDLRNKCHRLQEMHS